ncbi:MAG: Bug family tripartite tricarboxylate transporter substrate binding protein [Gemmatimonas sp.]
MRSLAAAGLAAALALSAALGPGVARAQSPGEFYKDKRIDLIISSTVGGGNDVSARLLARYFSPNMPGNPTMVPRNMPGAGGVTAANHVYNISAKDGTAIGMVQNSAVFDPLYGNDKALYDGSKFNWLGSPGKETAVLIVWHTVPVKDFADARQRGLTLGVSGGLNATPAFYSRVLAHVFRMNIKMIAGYPGQAEAFLALERGENEGYPSVFWSSLKSVKPDWIADKKVKMLLQIGDKPHPELAGVPSALDLLKDDKEMRPLMELAVAPLAVGRPMLAPPGVPADRVQALRTAIMATFKDSGYLGECERLKLECTNPTSGEELAKIVADSYNAPAPLTAKLRELNNPPR